MVTGGLESVFIGDPVDGDEKSFRSSVRIRTTRNGADIFRFRSDSLLKSVGFYLNSVFTGKAKQGKTQFDKLLFKWGMNISLLSGYIPMSPASVILEVTG